MMNSFLSFIWSTRCAIILCFKIMGLHSLNELISRIRLTLINEYHLRTSIFTHCFHSLLLKDFSQESHHLSWGNSSSFSHLFNTLNPSLRNIGSHVCNTLTSQLFFFCISLGHQNSLDFGSLTIILSSCSPSLSSIDLIHRFHNFLWRNNISYLHTLNCETCFLHSWSNFRNNSVCEM